MADEPVSEQQPVEEDAVEVEPEEQEPVEPTYMTPDQVAEAVAKSTNELKTWLGRRDKDLFNQVGTLIEEKVARPPEKTSDEVYQELVNNPKDVIRSEMQAFNQEQTDKEIRHSTETLSSLGSIMESDPLYSDKDLGNEVVEEIKKQISANKVDRSLPPNHAAKLILADSLSNVMRNRARKKVNPLSANTPTQIGGLTPGAAPPAPKKKMPNLSDKTKAWAKKWGYSEKDLIDLYGK